MNTKPKLVLLEQHPAKVCQDQEAARWAKLISIMRDINRRCRATGYDGDALLALFVQLSLCCQLDDE